MLFHMWVRFDSKISHACILIFRFDIIILDRRDILSNNKKTLNMSNPNFVFYINL